MNRTRGFVAVVVAQVALLLAWAGYHEWNRASAPTILLETTPVDPRDLLRGDYMTLGYKIGRVPVPQGPNAAAKAGSEIWVTLQQSGRFYAVTDASWVEPKTVRADTVVAKGRVRGQASAGFVSVDYGIEKYFVPEGKGQPIFREMAVEATIGAGGRLGIGRLLLDGQSYP